MANQPKPKKKVVPMPKETMAEKVMMAPGRTFAKGMKTALDFGEKYGKKARAYAQSKGYMGGTGKPTSSKPKTPVKATPKKKMK